ncbi:flagellar cap protein FliD N-terminal domain-containing protein [Paraclostridium bifermentans]|nr:flagellar cap protein FliD N-terminal domain-containing protein [Paraclostridium bifermentans]
MKDIKSLQDNYFSVTSKNSIINSNAWNTLTIGSSNENVITASGSAGANKVDYSFNVKELAQQAKMTSNKAGLKKIVL